ncbi:YdeI/OmpD-associated family protein [Kribbella sp.]|uniref:YdeI/OmpD-associated family protein n=1 Tax=Kribbella sp. TaxID=1871183 RepID=UPI002D33DA61|nr:YdeI/OmpD-associated family protein [Kribbella sp.]HZX05923.1 YdeI/OmpD-associated family protein [Kribbella sp.]
MTTELIIENAVAWRTWLGANHADSDGVWLVLAKKNVTTPTSLTYDEALEEALCHGWIDGQRRGRDEQTFIQRYTPRRERSMWSQRNVDLIARLDQEGRMHPAGHAEVERAKADGRWDKAYGGASAREIPDDLAAALAAEPRAQAMFEILTSANRFGVIFRVNGAKRPETRAKRIAQFVEQLARGETIYPQKRTL